MAEKDPYTHKTAEIIWADMIDFCCFIEESGTNLSLDPYDQSEYYTDVSKYTYSYTLWSVGIGRKLFRLHLPVSGFPLTAVRILKNSDMPEEVKITTREQLRDYTMRWLDDPFVQSMIARANPRELTEKETNKCIEILQRYTASRDRKTRCSYSRERNGEITTFTGSVAVNEMKHDLAKVVNFEKNTVLRDILANMKYSTFDRDIEYESLLETGDGAISCFMKDIRHTWKEGEPEAIYHRNCVK